MPQAKRTPITKTCVQCGATFTRPNWRYYENIKFCTPACYAEYRRQLPEDQRAALMSRATDVIRGSKRSESDLCKRAQTKQERCVLSGDEAEIMAAFERAGLHPVPLYAFSKYNIDFAFPEQMVAVEYHGGNWHNTAAKQAQDASKAAFLREAGWTLLVFPRLDKPQANDAGNRRIAIDDIVRQTVAALTHSAPR